MSSVTAGALVTDNSFKKFCLNFSSLSITILLNFIHLKPCLTFFSVYCLSCGFFYLGRLYFFKFPFDLKAKVDLIHGVGSRALKPCRHSKTDIQTALLNPNHMWHCKQVELNKKNQGVVSEGNYPVTSSLFKHIRLQALVQKQGISLGSH